MGTIERGDKLRLVHSPDAKVTILQPVLEKHFSPDVDTIYTDEHVTYPFALHRTFGGKHKAINHSRTYGIGPIHTNTIENAFSLLKRGLYGAYHKVSIKYLARSCAEFSYRFNRRGEQLQMFDGTLKNLLKENALPYKSLIEKGLPSVEKGANS